MENVQIHRDIKLITTEQEEAKLSYCRVFQGASVGYRNDETKIHMNKPVYLGLLILELSKTLMYELWCDFVKPKYGEKTKLCYMDTDSFIVHKKQVAFTKRLQEMLNQSLTIWKGKYQKKGKKRLMA